MRGLWKAADGAQEEERMSDTPSRKRLYVWIPLKLFADAQYRANLEGKTLTEIVIEALSRFLGGER